MAKYILIRNLKVSKANACPSAYIIGPPSMTAFHGFVQALLLSISNNNGDLNEAENLIIHEGFSVIHKDIQMLGEMRKIKYDNVFFPEQISSTHAYDKDDCAKGGYRLALQPEAKCNIEIDIVIRVSDDVYPTKDSIQKFLYSGRIAGGMIDNTEGFDIFIEENELNVQKNIKGGHFIKDRHDLLLKNNDKSSLQLMLELTRHYKNKKREHWLIPNCVGYLGLTDFKDSNLSRNGNQVAFAEPIITLTEYVSVQKEESIPFWLWTEKEVCGKKLFILKGEHYEQN